MTQFPISDRDDVLDLLWLPRAPDAAERLARAKAATVLSDRLSEVVALANCRRDFLFTRKLDRAVAPCLADPELRGNLRAHGLLARRMAVLSSHTVDHLGAAITVGGLGRGLALDLHFAPYGQYRQILLGPPCEIDAFAPELVLLSLDLQDAGLRLPITASARDVESVVATKVDELVGLWRRARERFGATVIQQTFLNTALPLFGSYEAMVPAAPFTVAEQLNALVRQAAQAEGVLIFDLDRHAARQGRQRWIDPVRWHLAKQLVSPDIAPIYGDLVARVVAASLGLSRKCLVLDLDNTLWGGVIGDDGMENIQLGQGSAIGEAYLAFQTYCQALAQRGVILAVCSKNDEANALEPFDSHPEMLLRRRDIGAFVANWEDKPRNIREIAATLEIGIDSLVFVDDNPAERAIVRRELPMVAVPELPDDVAHYAARLADAGYFEAVAFTADDASRSAQYSANSERRSAEAKATDTDSFLRSLDMCLTAQPVSKIDLARVTQLTNKTNQFNLTTRRYRESDIRAFMADPRTVTLQARLTDCFGDNGLIAVIVARPDAAWPDALLIDTWLMSCRVLGRGVEQASLELLAAAAQKLGARELIGEYLPTPKNGMVAAHYSKLGFEPTEGPPGQATFWRLSLEDFRPAPHHIAIRELVA